MKTEPTEPIPPAAQPSTLAVVPPGETPPLESMERADTPAIWQSFEEQFNALRTTAGNLVVVSIDQKDDIATAKAARKNLKDLRLAVEKRRKELGDGFLRAKRDIDSAAKRINELIEPLEEKMLGYEKFAEVEEKRLADLKLADRVMKVTELGANPALYNLAVLSDEDYTGLLALLEQQAKDRAEAASRAEREAAEAEGRRVAEEKRLEQERQRLAAEEAERNRVAAEEAERQRVEREAEQERLRVAAEAEAKRLQAIADEEAEQRRKAEQEAQAQREKAAAAEAEAERLRKAERDRVAAETRKRAEEATAEAMRKNDIRKSREAALISYNYQFEAGKDVLDFSDAVFDNLICSLQREKLKAEASAAPDLEKLSALANQLANLPVPEFSTKEFKAIRSKVAAELQRAAITVFDLAPKKGGK